MSHSARVYRHRHSTSVNANVNANVNVNINVNVNVNVNVNAIVNAIPCSKAPCLLKISIVCIQIRLPHKGDHTESAEPGDHLRLINSPPERSYTSRPTAPPTHASKRI